MTLTVSNAKDIADLTKNDYHFIAQSSKGQAVHTVDVVAQGLYAV